MRKVIVSLICLIATTLLIGVLAGYRPYIVRSDTLAPEYVNGDLVIGYIHSTPSPDSIVIIHSLPGVLDLARSSDDEAQDLIATVVARIPHLGNAVEFLLQQKLLMWVVVGALIVYALCPRALLKTKSTEQEVEPS